MISRNIYEKLFFVRILDRLYIKKKIVTLRHFVLYTSLDLQMLLNYFIR